MGGAASVEQELPHQLTKDQTIALVGHSFSEDLWTEYASEGVIQYEKLKGLIAQSNALEPPVMLIPFDRFCRIGKIPRCPNECVSEWGSGGHGQEGLLVDSRVVDLSSAFVVMVSHSWLRVRPPSCEEGSGSGSGSSSRPDNTENEKYHLCVEGINRLLNKCTIGVKPSECYLWIDYSCLNQDDNPCQALKSFGRIFSMCHIMFTPVIDHNFDSWELETSPDGPYADYQADGFQDDEYGYLSRGWCRLEMMYAKSVPLTARVIPGQYQGSLRTALEGASRRPHYLFGHREAHLNMIPLCLPPPSTSHLLVYDPWAGKLTYKSDMVKIKSLMLELKLLTSTPKVGYSGDTNSDNKPHGKGVHVYASGNIYSGEWQDGKKHGQGKIVFAAGDVFEGEYCDGRKQGRGSFFWLDGDKYSGSWNDDQMHGEGTFSYANGNIYKGYYDKGREHGKGKLIILNDTVFDGLFRDGIFVSGINYDYKQLQAIHARRTSVVCEHLARPDAHLAQAGKGDSPSVEVFRFSDFVPSTESKDTAPPLHTASPQSALKKSEKVIIPGKYFFEDGSLYVGEINVLEKSIHGQGKWTYSSGEEHDGMFDHGLRHGKGAFTTAEGDQLTGVWNRDVLSGDAIYEYANGDVFEGEYRDGKKNGSGRLTTEGGKVLEGTWQNDVIVYGVEVLQGSKVIEGVSYWSLKCIDASGCTYEGEVKGNIMHGNGRYTYPNGDVYEGNFENGKKSGKGSLEFTSSHTKERILYVGDFDNNIMNGKGTMTFENKSSYVGDFVDGCWDGQGVFYYANGDEYRGGYKNNKKQGFGIFTWADGSSYEGGFAENKWSGKGKYKYSNGDEYVGGYYNGRKHGLGKFVWADSCAIYQGEYREGVKHGFGRHVYSSGDVYEGMYENNHKHGMGKLTLMNGDGDVYEGPFVGGKKHGVGRVTLSTGEVFEVTFNHDERVSQKEVEPNGSDNRELEEGSKRGVDYGKGRILNLEDDDDDTNSVGNRFSTRYNATTPSGLKGSSPSYGTSSNIKNSSPLNTAWQ